MGAAIIAPTKDYAAKRGRRCGEWTELDLAGCRFDVMRSHQFGNLGVVVQFEGGDSYQGMPSGVPQKPPRMPALAAVTGWSQRLKSFSLLFTLAASLKRSPDTNRSSQTAPLPI
jgi:hypothetical protein